LSNDIYGCLDTFITSTIVVGSQPKRPHNIPYKLYNTMEKIYVRSNYVKTYAYRYG
jgi:hypothetical protein